MSSSLTKALRL